MGAPTVALTGLALGSSFRDALPELVVDWSAADAPDPRLVVLNEQLADDLGLDPDALRSDDGVGVLSGARTPAGAHPVAMAYAGHQFGSYAPLLGDGRALLLGELTTPAGDIVDLHLKGSGRTPFARGGDGKAALGPMLREYLIAEAMHALGIPTTRSLAVVTTGEQIARPDDRTGAVLARTATSHIRVGTFEYAARLPDPTVLRRLANTAIERHYPHLREQADPELGLLDAVVEAKASLVAEWMAVGFIHGVMNTDNTTISGETIDYGPCAFIDRFDPDTVFSSIDHGGRYRFGHQPRIAQWNLTRFAETLLGLHDDVDAAIVGSQDILESFPQRYARHWNDAIRRKLGLLDARDGDEVLFADLFSAMQTMEADLTTTFRSLGAVVRTRPEPPAGDVVETALDAWIGRWQDRLGTEGRGPDEVAAELDRVNPLYIPRNHLVEEALAAAADGDRAPFERLIELVTRPFEPTPAADRYAEPAPASFSSGYRTFCGT